MCYQFHILIILCIILIWLGLLMFRNFTGKLNGLSYVMLSHWLDLAGWNYENMYVFFIFLILVQWLPKG